MTRLRLSVITLALVLFTAALGIALGAGPLQDDMHDAFLRRPAQTGPDPEQQQRMAALQRTVQYDNDAVTAVAPSLLAGRLEGRPVAVLALPGADPAHVDAVVGDIEAADGFVSARLRVGPDLIDPAARTLVDTLSAGQLKEYDDLDVPDSAGVYDRVGLILGRAILTDPDSGEAIDDAASSVLNGFMTADLLSGEMPDERASLAVIVAGPEQGDDETSTAEASIVASLAQAVDSRGDGAVLAGPPGAADPGGAVAAVREDTEIAQTVSTVDTVDTRLGQIGAVLALVEQASGSVGHYGVMDAPDGAMPR